LKVGIIGAGGIAQKMHLPALARLPDVKVTHLAGRKEHRLRLLAERYDVPHWTTNYTDLLANDAIDAIIIALPHPQHVPVGLEALAAGKHLLMQKPLCGDMAEADAFVEAADRTSRTVLCLPHYGAEVRAARRLVQEGAIGRPSGAHCRTSHGGPEVYYAEIRDWFGEPDEGLWFFQSDQAAVGALFDMGVYAVSSLVGALGTVTSVIGHTATLDKPTTLEDTATLILQFANGAVGTAETSWCDPARTWQFRIHGTRGKLIAPGHDGASLTRWEPGSYTREDEPAIPHAVDCAQDDSGDVHAHWLNCIREGRQPELSNARTARHVTEILLAGLESSRTGRRIPIHSTL
jgi:predicted dehydrogenase